MSASARKDQDKQHKEISSEQSIKFNSQFKPEKIIIKMENKNPLFAKKTPELIMQQRNFQEIGQ